MKKFVPVSGLNRLDTERENPFFETKKYWMLLRQIHGLAATDAAIFFLGILVSDQDCLLRRAKVAVLQNLADGFRIVEQRAPGEQAGDKVVGHADGGGNAAGQDFAALFLHHKPDEKLAEMMGNGIRLLGFGVADNINRVVRKVRHEGSSRFSAWGVFALLDVFLREAAKSSVRRRELRKFVRY